MNEIIEHLGGGLLAVAAGFLGVRLYLAFLASGGGIYTAVENFMGSICG